MSADIRKISLPAAYKEETVKVPAAIALLLIILITVPLILWILRINDDGTRSANVSNYEALIEKVGTDVKTVEALLRDDADELESILNARKKRVVTLIVPDVVIVEEEQETSSDQALKASVDGIYWSASNPLVSINGETYRQGEIIQGYKILKVGKTIVDFEGPDGTIVTIDMYGDLLKGSKR